MCRLRPLSAAATEALLSLGFLCAAAEAVAAATAAAGLPIASGGGVYGCDLQASTTGSSSGGILIVYVV
jgi:hypothetical protein